MPIYEYKCSKCGRITEVWQKYSDPPLERCEACGGTVTKIISNNTFHLKGTGWYVTDYASGRTGPAKEEKSKSSTKDEGQKKTAKESGTEGSPKT
jgi:putative FmdB family regulatory protein